MPFALPKLLVYKHPRRVFLIWNKSSPPPGASAQKTHKTQERPTEKCLSSKNYWEFMEGRKHCVKTVSEEFLEEETLKD